jgi:hypothetical protein
MPNMVLLFMMNYLSARGSGVLGLDGGSAAVDGDGGAGDVGGAG